LPLLQPVKGQPRKPKSSETVETFNFTTARRVSSETVFETVFKKQLGENNMSSVSDETVTWNADTLICVSRPFLFHSFPRGVEVKRLGSRTSC
jgi:hypothetical protein